jgi:hypothetical protein
MMEINDEWAAARRHMSFEALDRTTENAEIKMSAVTE